MRTSADIIQKITENGRVQPATQETFDEEFRFEAAECGWSDDEIEAFLGSSNCPIVNFYMVVVENGGHVESMVKSVYFTDALKHLAVLRQKGEDARIYLDGDDVTPDV